MAKLEFLLFGYPVIKLDGQQLELPSRRLMALLVYLAMHPESHDRAIVGELLWDEDEDGRRKLRRLLYNNKELGIDDWILATKQSIQIHPDIELSIDVDHFQKAVAPADHAVTMEDYRAAVQVYTDDFLAGFSIENSDNFAGWLIGQRAHYRNQNLLALEKLAYFAQEQGDAALATQYVHQILDRDPLRESMHRMLMRLYVQQKQRDRAMHHYHMVVRLLRDEMGIDPQPATRQLYDDMLKMQIKPEDTDPLLVSRETRTDFHPPAPAKLIGRERAATDIYQHIFAPDVNQIVLVGVPGSGKTALAATIVNSPDLQMETSDGLLWITLGAEPDLPRLLSDLCSTMNVTPNGDIETTSMKLQAAVKDRHMLMVIDDVWSAEHARPFLLTGPNARAIITTRFPSIARTLAGRGGEIHNLDLLSSEEAMQIVAQYSDDVVDIYGDRLAALLPKLGGLPLAVSIVGRMLVEEWDYGMVDDFLDNLDADLSHLLDANTQFDLFDSPLNRGVPIRNRFLAGVSDDVRPAARELLPQIEEPIRASHEVHMDDLQNHWQGVDDLRETVKQFTEAGIMIPLGRGLFAVHPLWFEVVAG